MAPKLPRKNTDPAQLGIRGFFAKKTPQENITSKQSDSNVQKPTIKRPREGDGDDGESERKSAKFEYETLRTPLASRSANSLGQDAESAILIPDSSPPHPHPSSNVLMSHLTSSIGSSSASISRLKGDDTRSETEKGVKSKEEDGDSDWVRLLGSFGDMRLVDRSLLADVDASRIGKEAGRLERELTEVNGIVGQLAKSAEQDSGSEWRADHARLFERKASEFRLKREGVLHPMKIAQLSEV